jgi:hypothetical protein
MKQSAEKAAILLSSSPAEGWLHEQPLEFQIRMALAGRWITVPRGGMIYTIGEARLLDR